MYHGANVSHFNRSGVLLTHLEIADNIQNWFYIAENLLDLVILWSAKPQAILVGFQIMGTE